VKSAAIAEVGTGAQGHAKDLTSRVDRNSGGATNPSKKSYFFSNQIDTRVYLMSLIRQGSRGEIDNNLYYLNSLAAGINIFFGM
jgi:hypothetical protein